MVLGLAYAHCGIWNGWSMEWLSIFCDNLSGNEIQKRVDVWTVIILSHFVVQQTLYQHCKSTLYINIVNQLCFNKPLKMDKSF